MVQRTDDHGMNQGSPLDPSDDDDRVGAAVEAYLALAEQGQPPAIDEFVARFPDLENDVRAALEGLELVHGLLGLESATGSGSGRGAGVDHRIESGRRIAGYRVVRELGRGGMGTVYEAVHVALDRPVALKVLGTHAAPDSSARRRFLNEARTTARLHHTHIVPVFDVGQVGALCYYAMQRIEGSGLDRVLRHLRRTRPVASAGGDSLAGSRLPKEDRQAASSASSIHSRLGRLWSRLSPGWVSRQPRPAGRGPGSAGAGTARSVPRLSQPGNAAHAPAGLGDSTASWDTGGRLSPRPGECAGENAASGVVLSAIELDRRRRDDEPPPFDPKRGSAYFRWVAEVGLQSADALAHAHHQGVIHRDVKPSNLLIDAKGNIWVTDFGLARRLADPGVTHHDSLLGTPRYMSPEQARTGSIDGRTDVYSLGATLYELLTLRPPFDGQTAAELIDQIGQLEPVPPRAIDPRVPRDLETIVLKALAKRPADRYRTAEELAADLTRFLNREPVKARRISPVGRLWRVACRHPGITSVTTVAAATILAIATYAYVRVVVARNQAVDAAGKLQEAMLRIKEADREKRADMKKGFLQAAVMVGQSPVPNRRKYGLELISKAVALEPEPELRRQLRDEAVTFLVLRDVETGPELATGRAHGLVFGPSGRRLAVLSEDDEDLAFWHVERRQRLATLSLGAGSGAAVGPPEMNVAESSGDDPAEPGPGAGTLSSSGSNANRNGARAGATSDSARRGAGRSLTLAGNCVAVLLPDDSGVRLIDALSSAPIQTLHRPNRVVGVFGDPASQRLVTIEMAEDDAISAAMDPTWDPHQVHGEYVVNLWDLDHLDKPKATLPWGWPSTPSRPRPGSPPRPAPSPRSVWPPLVAMSPDGKTVAVAPWHGTWVRLFSAQDGNRTGFIVDTQELLALALGPNALLATAGGGTVRLYDLDTRKLVTSLTPTQNFTWLMRFSPRGTLLAIAGIGPIELWDPVAHSLVAVLSKSEQANELAFAPDGRTLAEVGHGGVASVWTVNDSAARTQLTGFDARPSSLAFSDDGVLAGGGWNGEVWFWRNGRCPEVGSPLPRSSPNETVPAAGRPGPQSASPPRAATPGSGAGSSPSPSSSSALSTNLTSAAQRRSEPSGRGGDGRRGPMMNRGPGGGDSERPTWLAFDAFGRLVAHDMKGLRIWPAGSSSAQPPPILQLPLPPALGTWFTPMAKTPDGQTMVLVRSSAVFLWRSQAPDRLIPVIPLGHSAAEPAPAALSGSRRGTTTSADAPALRFHAVQIAPLGDRVYLIDQKGLLHAWAIESTSEAPQAQARELDWGVPLAEGASSLALRRDGAVLAVGDRSGTVTLLDTTRQTVLERIKPSSGEAESLLLALAFSPDGRDLAVGSQQGSISIWSIAQPKEARLRLRLPGHRGLVTSLVFDPQGRRLVSAAGIDPLVEVWDLDLLQRELMRLGLAD